MLDTVIACTCIILTRLR